MVSIRFNLTFVFRDINSSHSSLNDVINSILVPQPLSPHDDEGGTMFGEPPQLIVCGEGPHQQIDEFRGVCQNKIATIGSD